MRNNLMRGGAAALAAVVLSGCAYPVYRERVVYRDRPVYQEPPQQEAPVRQGNAPIYDPGPGYSQAPAPQAQAPRGQKYGVVRSIDRVGGGGREAQTSGGGALLGGILGAVIGRQFGGSSGGRAAGTAIGAFGGAIVGNEVERNNNAVLSGGGHYRVQVQLDNGGVRDFYFQDLAGMRIGDRVVVQGKNLQLV